MHTPTDMAPWSKAAVVLSLATCIECFMVPSAVIARPRALALRAPASLRLYMRHSSPEEKKKKEKTSSWITMRRSLVQAATLQLVNVLSCAAAMTDEMPPEMVEAAKQGKMTFEPRGITAQDTVVFVIGFIPFIWATNEFWRRIVAGESFGTGASSVIIDPNAEVEGSRFRGRSVLGRGAMNVAYLLFASVGITVALVAFTVFQELSK